MEHFLIFLVLFIWVLKGLNLAYSFYLKQKNYPPGPLGLPILGYSPWFAYKSLHRLLDLAKSYPNVCTLHLGTYRVLMLNSFHAVQEAFKEDAFSGRPNLKMLEVRNGGVGMGLVCSQGRTWQEQRKFTLKHLRDLGFGKRSMEGLLMQEVNDLMSWLRDNVGVQIDLKRRLNLAVLNAFWSIIGSERYSQEDAGLQEILEKTSADLSETQYTGPLLFLPWLLRLAPCLTRWKEFQKSIAIVHNFLQNIIKKHKQNDGGSGDFIDSYLAEIRRTKDTTSSFYKKRGEHSLQVVLLDLFMAGADTTSATLYWAILFMVLHVKVQRKVQEEIDAVLGNSAPTLEHRKLMPYTEATVNEVMRKSSLVPMGLFHSTMSKTRLLGYNVPKETVVMANLFHLNNAKELWGDPEAFRPERFLDQEGKQLRKYDHFIPFSIGKRSCPGENLARDQIFLFFVALLQNFIFEGDHREGKLTDEPRIGVILSPKPFAVVARNRVVVGI